LDHFVKDDNDNLKQAHTVQYNNNLWVKSPGIQLEQKWNHEAKSEKIELNLYNHCYLLVEVINELSYLFTKFNITPIHLVLKLKEMAKLKKPESFSLFSVNFKFSVSLLVFSSDECYLLSN